MVYHTNMRVCFVTKMLVLIGCIYSQDIKADGSTKLDAENSSSKTLTIDIGAERAPFTVLLSNGQATGLYIEFWEMWSRYSGVQVKFEVNGFSNIQHNLDSGVIDLYSGLFKNDQREQWADFSIPFHRVKTGLYFLQSSLALPDLKQLNQSGDQTVAVHKDSFQSAFLEKKYPNIPLIFYVEADDIFNRFISGEIKAIFAEQPYMNAKISGKGLRGLFKLGHANILENDVYAVVAKGNHQLLKIINQGIRNIPIAEVIALEKRWLPNTETFFKLSESGSLLTRSELEWLKKLHELKLGIDADWYPYEFLDENSKHIGISADYIQYIRDNLPLQITAQINLSWLEAFEQLKVGDIDLLTAIVKTKEREAFLNFTEPYAIFPSVVATYKDSIFVQDTDSLNGRLVGVEKGLILEDIYRKNHPKIKLVTFDRIIDALEALTRGEIEAVIADLASINRIIIRHKLTNISIAAFSPYELKLSIGVRKGLEPLVPILNKTLAKMTTKQRAAIANNWSTSKSEVKINYQKILVWGLPIAFSLLTIILTIIRSNRQLRFEILEREKIEISLASAKEKAISANIAKDNFLANMSHEIRTPMNAVVGMSDLLSGTSLDKEQTYFNDAIQTSAASLLFLINDILDLSKIEAGKLELENRPFSLNILVKDIHSQISLEIKKHQIDFQNKMDQSIPEFIVGDSTRLSQILLNLLNNAVKFTHNGRITLSAMVIPVSKLKFGIEFCVTDTGIGISSFEIGKLFESYGQADASTTRKYGGTGLGLSISKQLCQLMGGDIWVKSEVGVGSRFFFTAFFESNGENLELPLSNKNLLLNEKNSNLFGRTAAQVLKGVDILLVDDNEVNLFIAQRMLSNAGATITTAINGQIAVDKLTQQVFDVVLMDIQMPVMDGYQATQIIRNELGLTKLPVIAISANVMDIDIESGKRAGINAHLGKPIKRQKMIALIKEHVLKQKK